MDTWRRLITHGWQQEAAEQLFQRVSELATTDPENEAPQVIESALSTEVYLSSFVDSNLIPSGRQIDELGHLIGSLVAASERLAQAPGSPSLAVAATESRPPPLANTQAVYFYGLDADLAAALSVLLESEDIRLEAFGELGGLLSKLDAAPPVALVIDTGTLEAEPNSVNLGELAETMHSRLPTRPPCLVIGRSKDLALRVEAMRAGADAFFALPVTAEQLRDRIHLLRNKNEPERRRVLVVEDDPGQADFAVKVLAKADIEAVAVTEPLKVMEVLEAFRPDLILMDLYMPDVSGSELTSIIREHNEYSNVPIVFLSGELDQEKQFQALTVGGDDFLPKPIRPKHLIETVQHRIERNRAMQNRLGMLGSQDLVTKLFNRGHFVRVLDQAIRNRTALPAACALLFLEIDDPERVHDQVGIGGTDEVLAKLGSLIASLKRSVDVAARFGDHSFCVFARRDDKEEIEQLAAKLGDAASGHLFEVSGNALKFTTSIGVAHLGFDIANSSSLIARGEKACLEARRCGGARVVTFIPDESEIDTDQKLKFMLMDAVVNQRFRVFYQPVVSLRGLKGNRYDLQLKLEDENGVQVGEDRFRPLASAEGLDRALDEFVIDQALTILGKHSGQGNRLILLLRLSATALKSDAWAGVLAQRLNAMRLSTRVLILEFGFAEVNARLSEAIRTLTSLRRLGFTSGLENVGSDPLSLSLIDELPSIYLRLDPELLRLDPADLTELITRIHKKNRVVIVTGINDARSVNTLWACGVDYLQGDFIQPPQETPSFDNSEFQPG